MRFHMHIEKKLEEIKIGIQSLGNTVYSFTFTFTAKVDKFLSLTFRNNSNKN